MGNTVFNILKSGNLNNINNCGVDLAERFGFTKLEPFRDVMFIRMMCYSRFLINVYQIEQD
jgi:hypothetical protein